MIVWSLSIEEQFYLVWPLVLFACLALGLKRRSIAGGLALVILAILVHRYLLLESGGGLESSLLRHGYAGRRAPGRLRFWIPALQEYRTAKQRVAEGGRCLRRSCSGLINSYVDFKDEFLYRGGFTAVAIICGVLIYAAANTPPRILSTALRFTPLVWLGPDLLRTISVALAGPYKR